MEPPRGTQAAILARLREGPRQAQELAGTLGLDTSAVRRHLEGLHAQGLVEAQTHVEGPGRPKKRYGLTAKGREVFPREYALLLDLLLAKLRDTRGHAEAERLMGLVAKDLAAQVEGRTGPERLAALLALYNRLGFEADLERQGGAYGLRQRNCIFLQTARSDPRLLCECLDEGLIRAALPGARVELEASLALGDAHCRHRIRLATG